MLRRIADRVSGWLSRTPRAHPAVPAAAAVAGAGSHRHLARAAGGEWRRHCAVAAEALPTLDGGLDRTAVRVWRDGRRAALPMGSAPRASR